MKIQRLRVANLRQFRAPFELADILPGLNIFTGANETGKSTLVRAIRAAYFERHRSSSVEDLRPYGDSLAAPLIELDFHIAGTAYRLTKSFLHKKRCELVAVGLNLEGVAAEDFMAERLGFEFAKSGSSKEAHWGIPGLLWIDQGAAQAVRGSVENATTHLRKALDESLGEVAASGGDEIVAQVRTQRDELLTAAGKPRAAYQKAIDDASALDQQVAELKQAVSVHRSRVDELKQLRDAHGVDVKDQPWTALREQQTAATRALQAVEALNGELDREREKLRQATGLRDLLVQRLHAADVQQQSLAARQSAFAAAATQQEQAAALEAQCLQTEAVSTARLRAAREALALARQEDSRKTLARQVDDAQARAIELAAVLERAVAEDVRSAALKRAAALQHIAAADLTTLRQQQARLTELEIRQAAVATRLRFDLDVDLDLNGGTTVRLEGDAVQGQGERLLLTPTTIAIEGVGRFHIAPGGTDLAELAQQQVQLQGEHHALKQRLGLASLAEAEARDRAQAQSLAEAQSAEKACKVLAPKGLDALRSEWVAAQARHAQASVALSRLPAATTIAAAAVTAAPALEAAERDDIACRDAAERATAQLQLARQALAAATTRRDDAQREQELLKASLDDPSLQAELVAKRLALVEAGARASSVKTAIESIDSRIAAARPDILKQDVERLRRSAEEAERCHRDRALEIVKIETQLGEAGAHGIEEDLARRQRESAQAMRRCGELQQRAQALAYLLERLELRRRNLTRRLQAPLQKHLDRYLQLLFPSGRLEVDDALVPGALTRPNTHGPLASDFETLSFGAREQMGVISRLAYADLLKEAGRPTLIILDDALVHSDTQRLDLMKRVLFDAAQRHQVLLFTCHPGHWKDMGVALRPLEGGR